MMCNIIINEQKDRPNNPYYHPHNNIFVEDDYSEESNANSVYFDWAVSVAERAIARRKQQERLIR